MKYVLINENGHIFQISEEEFESNPEGHETVELTAEQAIEVDASAEALFLVEGELVSFKAMRWMENPEAVKASLRPERDRLLTSSDWTQLKDTTLSETAQTAWSAYRQSLRDLTDAIDENGEVNFPEKPQNNSINRSMAKPNSRQTLIDYCMRSLGAPVIEINVDEDQVEDRVDEAMQFYQEYHSDSIVRNYRKHLVTAEDVTNGYVTVPDSMIFVNNIFPIGASTSQSGMFSVDYQMHFNDMYNLRNPGGLIDYEMTKQYMAMIDLKVNGMSQRSSFSRHQNRLYVEGDDLVEGIYIIVEGHEVLDPETYTDIYNDMLLKKYLVALIKRQWGANLIKFEGMQMPGGVTLNGRQIYDDAISDIEKIEETMQLTYEAPTDFFVG